MTRSVLVTGGGRGIGAAIAVRLGAAGFDVTVGYREREADAQETLKAIAEVGAGARLLRFDVSDRAACAAALSADLEASGPYWGVVCGAGVRADAAFPSLRAEDWDRVLRTNLDGFYNVLHPLVMPMIRDRKGGRIVTIT